MAESAQGSDSQACQRLRARDELCFVSALNTHKHYIKYNQLLYIFDKKAFLCLMMLPW